MTTPSIASASPVTTTTDVPLWVWATATVALIAAFFLLQENGALLSEEATTWLHEVTHDARHAMGVPCH